MMFSAVPSPNKFLALIKGGVFAWLAIGIFASCVQKSDFSTDDSNGAIESTPSPRPSSARSLDPLPKEPAEVVTTFYKDILPILSMNEVGRFYKCTVCHTSYRNPEMVAKSRVMDAIIDSIEIQKMPPDQNRMRPEDLEILKQWRRSGMQIGTPVAAPAVSGNGALIK